MGHDKINAQGFNIDFHHAMYAMQCKTSTGVTAKDETGSQVSYITAKFYDSMDAELTMPAGAASCVKSVFRFEPDFDYQMTDFIFCQVAAASSDCLVTVKGSPGIDDIDICPTGANLRLIPACIYKVGNVERPSSSDEVVGSEASNDIYFTCLHSAGLVHEFQIIFNLYKA